MTHTLTLKPPANHFLLLSLNNLGFGGTIIVVGFVGGENSVEVGDFTDPMNGNGVFSLEGEVLPECGLETVWGPIGRPFGWRRGGRVDPANDTPQPVRGFPVDDIARQKASGKVKALAFLEAFLAFEERPGFHGFLAFLVFLVFLVFLMGRGRRDLMVGRRWVLRAGCKWVSDRIVHGGCLSSWDESITYLSSRIQDPVGTTK